MSKNTYFKAELVMCLDNEESTDFQDLGTIDVIRADSLDALFAKLNRIYNVESFEVFENRLESGWINSITSPNYYESMSIYISEVTELELDETELRDFLTRGRKNNE
jgi:hypothetical protein